LNFFPLDFVI